MGKPVVYEKGKDGSYIHNCLLVRREGDPAISMVSITSDNRVTVTLNGYAIIPLAEYCKLTDNQSYLDETINRIKEADEYLAPQKDDDTARGVINTSIVDERGDAID